MEKFKDLTYVRPDYDAWMEQQRGYIAGIKAAKSYEELKQLILANEKYEAEQSTMVSIASIRNTLDTGDAFYEQEMALMYEKQGLFALLAKEAGEAILATPWREELARDFGPLMIKNLEVAQLLANPAIVEDLTKESVLKQEYSKAAAQASTTFRGEPCNFYGLLKHMQSTDREERREAFLAWADLYESISGALDEQYDSLVSLRRGIAKKLGFEDYIAMRYLERGRYDYKPEDVAAFRAAVVKYVVPVCERLAAMQAKRLGLDGLQWYDESLVYPEGNPTPIGTKDELVAKAQRMYRELSPESGEFFDFMVEHELFDLETRPGKHQGGYCTALPMYKAPFIFSNFNGTSADVDVLTHEAGHAFECYLASRIHPLGEMSFSTSEINEIHSMSMEHFTYPWMELFFEDQADKYRSAHLASSLQTIPYLVCVDEFQHRVFEENLDSAGRRRVWHELEEKYMPWRHYDGNKFLEEGGFWMQKQHIFLYPFYYVDYALAQMGAFEFFEKMCEDREAAWSGYVRLCKSGGSRGYFDTLAYAGLSNPFKEENIRRIVAFLETKLFHE